MFVQIILELLYSYSQAKIRFICLFVCFCLLSLSCEKKSIVKKRKNQKLCTTYATL